MKRTNMLISMVTKLFLKLYMKMYIYRRIALVAHFFLLNIGGTYVYGIYWGKGTFYINI